MIKKTTARECLPLTEKEKEAFFTSGIVQIIGWDMAEQGAEQCVYRPISSTHSDLGGLNNEEGA